MSYVYTGPGEEPAHTRLVSIVTAVRIDCIYLVFIYTPTDIVTEESVQV